MHDGDEAGIKSVIILLAENMLMVGLNKKMVYTGWFEYHLLTQILEDIRALLLSVFIQ